MTWQIHESPTRELHVRRPWDPTVTPIGRVTRYVRGDGNFKDVFDVVAIVMPIYVRSKTGHRRGDIEDGECEATPNYALAALIAANLESSSNMDDEQIDKIADAVLRKLNVVKLPFKPEEASKASATATVTLPATRLIPYHLKAVAALVPKLSDDELDAICTQLEERGLSEFVLALRRMHLLAK